MSYILEALKKSEKKRPPGPVPDLFTVQGPQPAASSRRPLAALAGAAVVIVLAGVGGWAWLGRRERVPEATPRAETADATPPASGGGPREAAGPGVAVAVPSDPSSPAPAPAPSRPAVAPAAGKRRPAVGGALAGGVTAAVPAPSPQPPPAASPAGSPPGPESVDVGQSGVQPGSAGESVVPVAAERNVRPVPTPADAPAAAVAPPPAAAAPAVSGKEPAPPSAPAALPVPAAVDAEPPAPQTAEAAAAEAPPADGRVVAIEELPQSVRAALGKFAISGHVWSEEPALRLLTVENRLVREGEEAAPGVRLEEITPDGAVLTLHGWRFRIGGF